MTQIRIQPNKIHSYYFIGDARDLDYESGLRSEKLIFKIFFPDPTLKIKNKLTIEAK